MQPLLYTDLVSWYRLIDPPADHEGEAASYLAALERGGAAPGATLLELGAGAGHNALFLKARYRCTLTELSPAMQGLSVELNPECEHLLGDMRTLRLGRTFDAVFVHDAVMYMTTEADLRAAIVTAYEHTRPGGCAVFAPDVLRENFSDTTVLLEHDEGTRSMRGIEWSWDPNPDDDTMTTEYVFVLRDGADVKTVHDRHTEGMFTGATWERLFAEVGYTVERVERALDEEGQTDQVFLCRRP